MLPCECAQRLSAGLALEPQLPLVAEVLDVVDDGEVLLDGVPRRLPRQRDRQRRLRRRLRVLLPVGGAVLDDGRPRPQVGLVLQHKSASLAVTGSVGWVLQPILSQMDLR